MGYVQIWWDILGYNGRNSNKGVQTGCCDKGVYLEQVNSSREHQDEPVMLGLSRFQEKPDELVDFSQVTNQSGTW